MKVRFTGVIEKRSGGCKCRGKTSGSSFVTSKHYILPSGVQKTFRVGVEEEVSDSDGEFLLSYSYTDPKGVTHNVFEVV